MRRFYNAIIGTCSVLFLWGSVEAAGAEQSVKTRIDSTVVELDNGDVVVKYSVKPFDFGTCITQTRHRDGLLSFLKRRKISISTRSGLPKRLLSR